MIGLLCAILVIGLVGGGAVTLVRLGAKHYWPAAFKRKPLNCAVCSGFHGSWIALAVLVAFGVVPGVDMATATAIVAGATVVAAWITQAVLPLPFEMPED